ncbi:MAG: putative Ig domain-containing protein [Nakamurella sp.]
MTKTLPRGLLNRVTAAHRKPRSRWVLSARRRRSARSARHRDDGFVLLETLLAIVLIAVVMAGFTTFFINSVAFTSQQRATQMATQIANSTVEVIRALPTSDLVNGHDAASVRTQFGSAPAAVTPWLRGMSPAVDRSAAAGSGVRTVVPTVAAQQTVNNVDYRVSSYFGTCVIPTGMTQNATCTAGSAATGISYLRAVIAVTWAGQRCPPTGCSFVTETLLSTVDDPLFSLTQSPPAAPELSSIGAQSSAVGDIVALPAAFTAVPTSRFAITSGTLPAGIFLDTATGLISGIPSLVTPSTPLTLTLTDGFGRTAAESFSWTVLAALSTTVPAAQASFIGTALSLTLPPATGGSPGYSWTDPGATLPPGLAVSTVDSLAVVTGTPTVRGVFPVSLTVTDSTTTRNSTVSFSWTTDYPPLVAGNPGPQTSTVGTPDSVTLSVTGGSGSVAWTGGETLPAGLTLSPAGVVSGTATSAALTPVVLVITDTETAARQNVPFSWTVYPPPSVNSLGNQSVTTGLSVSLQLGTSCPNAPCSYTLDNGPPTLGINSTGLLTGTITASAQRYDSVTISVTDNSGARVSSPGFAVTVNAAPSLSGPGNQVVAPGAAVSVDVARLTAGGTAPLTYSAVKLPSWLTLNSSTGLISGVAPSTAGGVSGTVLTVTDSYGIRASGAAFGWTVDGRPSAGPPAVPLAVVVANGDTRISPSWTAPSTGPVTSYTATASPGGASCTATGLTCSISGLTNGIHYSVTVMATNSFGTGPASAAVLGIPYPALMSAANGMTLWLDGADPTVLLSSSSCTGVVTTSAIGCWKDKSGQPKSNDFAQTTAGDQPGVSTWNGLTAANFADTSDVLNSVDASANYLTVFVAANVTNSATYINLFGQSGVDYNVRIGSAGFRSAPVGNDWSFNPAGTLNWANGSKLTNANGPIKIITSDQARSRKTFTASVSNALYGRGVVGQIGDVMTFDKPLSTAEQRSVEEYLARKWSVPITPQAPTAVTGSPDGSATATLSWTAPSFDGGAAITGYTVTAANGKTCTTSGLSCRIVGLPKGKTYTFTVAATNSVGAGPPSATFSMTT